ncbi:MAG: AraC family transcriptional regulator [Proteobacteria bacterium]|nr:AraC family transcriptional regulator [Pseudomonadota bacterium]
MSIDRRDIRHRDLVAMSHLVGSGYRALGNGLHEAEMVARGQFSLSEVRPGLLLHASDARHQRSVTTRMVKDRSINFSVVLAGGWRATLGGRPLASGGSSPQASTFVLAEPDSWQKHVERGDRARMVNVLVSPEWLEGEGLPAGDLSGLAVGALARRHLWSGSWRPSMRSVAMAQQVLSRPVYSGVLQRLHLESRAIEIVLEALATVTGSVGSVLPVGSASVDLRRLNRVRERLDDETGAIPSLSDLARDVGLSVRTLQRRFVEAFGMSVLEYARRRRLELARGLLERDGATVAQAAHAAGYAHAANFATAFRRHFGLMPREARSRA